MSFLNPLPLPNSLSLYCASFFCSNLSNSYFPCYFCQKLSFCSLKCLTTHRKETHSQTSNFLDNKRIPLDIFEEYEFTSSSQTNFFQTKEPPFEGVSKQFFQIKNKKSTENFILVLIKKTDIEANCIENILLSCKYLHKFSHPHLLKLHRFYEEKEQITLIFEPFTQNTLDNLLKQKKALMERNAFIYFTQICLAIDYLHKKQIFSLNLTLSNLLLDEKLDLKISDYAHKFWEKAAENAQTDILTLGKILYELIHGYSLFKGKNPKENGLNVPIQKKQKFASFLSDDVQDLLSKLLSEDKNKEVFGLKEIFSHKWMTKFYKLFKVDIEKFKQPQKKQRNSFEQKINNRKASLNCGIIITERKTEPSEAKRENLPSKSAFEEFSFRIQNIKVKNSFDLTSNIKSFTFHKSLSLSSNPNGNSSSLMKSSENSSKNKQKLTIKEGLNDTEIKNDFLKLQKCEKSLISKEEDEEISFWNRISNIVGCSCFKTKK